MQVVTRSISRKQPLTASFLAYCLVVLSMFTFSSATRAIDMTNWICEENCGSMSANGVVSAPPGSAGNYGWVATYLVLPEELTLTEPGRFSAPSLESRVRSPLFSATAGQTLTFYFNYVTSDGGMGSAPTDYAYARLIDSANNVVATLFTAKTVPSGDTVPGTGMAAIDASLSPPTARVIDGAPQWSVLGADSSGTCRAQGCGYTGWIRSNYVVSTSGSYRLEVLAGNVRGDGFFQTGLAFDSPIFSGQVVTNPVPDTPANVPTVNTAVLGTMAILLAGLAAGPLRRHRIVIRGEGKCSP